MISLVVAVSDNNTIGRDGELPWRLSDDLRRFKRLTTGKPIIMGRKTYTSIGKPLPDRQNIVMTRQAEFVAPGCDVVASADAAVAAAAEAQEIMVIGGADIYRAFLPLANRIYLTRVHADIDGDTAFPMLEDKLWCLARSEQHPADSRNAYATTFQVLDRRLPATIDP